MEHNGRCYDITINNPYSQNYLVNKTHVYKNNKQDLIYKTFKYICPYTNITIYSCFVEKDELYILSSKCGIMTIEHMMIIIGEITDEDIEFDIPEGYNRIYELPSK